MNELLILALLAAACTTSADYNNTTFICDGVNLCPMGQSCVAGFCATGGFDASDVDAGPALGEDIQLAPGWTADVWYDFSDDFTYSDLVYIDPGNNPADCGVNSDCYSNAPHAVALLEPPFAPGLAVLTTHNIIELRTPNVYQERVYFAGSESGTFPDAMYDFHFCDNIAGRGAGLCIAGASVGSGDGVFWLGTDWLTKSWINTANNTWSVTYDASGTFDSQGGPRLYYGYENGLSRDTTTITGGAVYSMEVVGDELAAVFSLPTMQYQLVRIQSGTHGQTVVASVGVDANDPRINRQNRGVLVVSNGVHPDLPGIHVIVTSRSLITYDANGSPTTIAETPVSGGWPWADAVLAPPDHPLGTGGPTFYILEANRDNDRDRILRLHKSAQ